MSVNKVILLGNLGADPEVRYTPSGAAVTTFTMATSKKFKDKNGDKQEKTQWHRIVAWRGLAEICGKFLQKGSQVYVEGEIETREYKDRDGEKRFITEIIIDRLDMLGNIRKPEGASTDHGGDDSYRGVPVGSDEIPF